MGIEKRKLRGGALIPKIGLGTFGSDKYSAYDIAVAVKQGLRIGYRLIDCASVYGNEAHIGEILEENIQGGIPRSELFIVSKVWNDSHRKGDVFESCARSLKDLRLDYLDLYCIHWPFRNFHPKGAPPDYHDPSATPYIHERYMETWYQMERLYKAGYVRHIGTSNMTIPKMKLLIRDCTIMPAANEMELHPSFQQEDLFQFCIENGIQPIGYSPLGSPSRPERDRTPDDIVDMEATVIRKIAESRDISPAQVCIKWAVQRGQIPIPFSTKKEQLKANLAVLTIDPLTEEEMNAIKSVESNCRLIKGQVFLWDGAKGWQDLWDLDGSIVS